MHVGTQIICGLHCVFHTTEETGMNNIEGSRPHVRQRETIIVYFLLGISPASNCSWPTFRNPVSVPSSKAGCTV